MPTARELAMVGVALTLIGCREPRKLTVDDGADAPGPAGFPAVAAERIVGLDIGRPGAAPVTLRRTGDGWRIVAPVDDAVDPAAAAGVLGEISRIEWSEAPVASQRAQWPDYGVEPGAALALTVRVAEGPLPTLHLGPRGHARIGEDERVFEIYRLSRYTVDREPRLWRDLRVLRRPRGEITRITVAAPGGATVVARREADGYAGETVPPGATFDGERAFVAIERALGLRAFDVTPEVMPAPALELVMATDAADPAPTVLRLGPTDGDRVLGQIAGDARVLIFEAARLGPLRDGPGALLTQATSRP